AAEYLGQLDGEIGDGDHGHTMSRGFSAVVKALNHIDTHATDISSLLALCAESFLDAVGATTGPLYASGLLKAANFANGRATLDAGEAPLLLLAICEGIAERGQAIVGDKTMMDVWMPVGQSVKSLKQEARPLIEVLAEIKMVANRGAESTRSMTAVRGRAARLGDRSLGHIDPGAASAAILIACFIDVLEQRVG
uniref:dihydroxyacetone kinase subunit DhaL n=1 Tax=Cohaesibacter celericrescens TaxID=2067669 RepID=UPI003565CC69